MNCCNCSGECGVLCSDWSGRVAAGRSEWLSAEERRDQRWIWGNCCVYHPPSNWRATEGRLQCQYCLYSLFLANVNSRSRSLYAIARPSVVCLSVCLSVMLVRPTQVVQIFRNISTALCTLAIHWHPLKISRRSSQGNPSVGGVKHKRGSQI